MMGYHNYYGNNSDGVFSSVENNENKEENNNINTDSSIKKRSSSGCVTCKIRKKRCDEVKPVCGDCMRLNRRCEYITKEMTEEQIRILKEEMMLIEKDSKSRKRRKKGLNDDENNEPSGNFSLEQTASDLNEEKPAKSKLSRSVKGTRKKRTKNGSKIIFNPLAMNMASITNSPVFQTMTPNTTTSNGSSFISSIPNQSNVDVGTNITNMEIFNHVTAKTAPYSSININTIKNPVRNKNEINVDDKILSSFDLHFSIPNNSHNNSNNFQIPNNKNNLKPNINNQQFTSALSPSFPYFATPSTNMNEIPLNIDDNNNDTTNNNNSNNNGSNSLPLSLNGEENIINFTDLFSTGFSKVVQDHFKTETFDFENNTNNTFNDSDVINNVNGNNFNPFSTQLNTNNSLSQLQEMFKLSPRFPNLEINSNQLLNLDEESYPIYNNVQLNEPKVLEVNSNENYNKEQNFDNNKLEKIQSLIKLNQQQQQQHIYTNPSIYTNSTLANLTPMGQRLYEYYRDKLSSIVCSAPKTENMYLNTFLPMAHVDKSVLYGIMAWSAFHLGGPTMEKQGNYYIKLAVEGFYKRPILNEEAEGKSKLLCDEVDDNDEEIVREPNFDINTETFENLQLSELNKDNMINMRLAAFLILCGVEICKGDVSKWSKYLTYGAKLIKLKGGLERFNESKDEHFLVTNYAYHDITALQVINERTIHFDIQEYEKMWTKSNELGFTDPLHGISSPVFKILAEISKLVISVQKLVKRSEKDELDDTQKINNKKNIAESPVDKIYGLDEEDYWIGEDSSVTSSVDDMFINGVPSTVSDEWPDPNFDKDVNLEDLDQVMIECQNLEQRIANVKPKLSPYVTNKELELQLTMFECFQVTAKIHLRQSVLRMNSASIEIQYLTNQLVKLLDVLLGSEVEACLCLPMFIAGMNCVTRKDRINMTKRFKSFIKRYKWKNVLRCQIVIRYIWKLNLKGEKFVDWYAVVKRLGWDLSFA
jgi:hypothetical protein